MGTYLKYAVTKNQRKKAEKFGLKWDYIKKSWYTENMPAYLELKKMDNQRIMKNQKKYLEKIQKSAWLFRYTRYNYTK